MACSATALLVVSLVFVESAPSPSLFSGDAQPIPANAIPDANNPLFLRYNLLLYFMVLIFDFSRLSFLVARFSQRPRLFSLLIGDTSFISSGSFNVTQGL